MAQTLIQVQELKMSHRDGFTLHIPEWTVEAGMVVGLVGPNAAGKTTLLSLLAGFQEPDEGMVSVFGKNPFVEAEDVRSRLGFMSDDMALFDMRVGGLLRTMSGYYATWDAGLVNELIERFKLNTGKRVRELSKGEGTRLRLVLAMAFRPQILLLDEPATGLDLGGRIALLKSVLEIVQEPERTVIISSHQFADIERIADCLLVLNDGHVVQEGPTHALLGDTRTLEEALTMWGAAG